MMRSNTVKTRLAAGETVVNAWLSIGSSYSAEGVGHSGVHSVTVDLQHGMLGFQEALHMLQAISATPAIPLVRVPDLDPAKIMHLLDAGAYGIICPMISTPEQAKALVAACRYPPFGNRSFGPSRGLLYGGKDYVANANETVMVIPMIETAEAVERIDEILAVEGIDMIYVGPNDLAFAVEGHVSFPRPASESAITRILSSAMKRRIPVGIFCSDTEDARARRDQGCALVTPGNDFGHLTRSISAAVTALADKEVEPPASFARSAHAAHGY
ncbi:HpcH/HpaI aldolase family protein [Devosia neptuniae]|uniref:HpcH/HpaI aldolase family protein n=1 Tax=Devosia neptuniae TaxID=191302 RepID=UPI0022AF07F2|nr:aldolase/citrate lyase family protein [Devosia neptuniae]MCZ4348155.1 aldolase/citrate lyase family protein [Devosia neptuniae]